MIHHVVFYELKPETRPEQIEEILRSSRTLLLKIPEVLSVKSGRNLDAGSQWGIFVGFDAESREKLRILKDDAYHLKFVEKIVGPHCAAMFEMDFELDPSKDLKYS